MHMRIVVRTIMSVCVLTLLGVCVVHAHPGGLDKYGGHWDHSTGTYHYHQQTLAAAASVGTYPTAPTTAEADFADILDAAKRYYAFNDYVGALKLLDEARGMIGAHVKRVSVTKIPLDASDNVEVNHSGPKLYIQSGQEVKGHLVLRRSGGDRVVWNSVIPTATQTYVAKFSSSEPSVAAISDKGEFTVLGPGKTSFTVAVGDKSAEVPLEVIDPGPIVGKTREELVKVLGWPENVQAGRWTYERFPGLIIAFEEDKAVMVNEWDPLNEEWEEAMK